MHLIIVEIHFQLKIQKKAILLKIKMKHLYQIKIIIVYFFKVRRINFIRNAKLNFRVNI